MRGETVWRDEKKNTQRAAQIFVRRPIFKGLLKKCPNECRPMIIERSIAPTRRVEVGLHFENALTGRGRADSSQRTLRAKLGVKQLDTASASKATERLATLLGHFLTTESMLCA